MTQNPRDHHYLPEFFIRRWADNNDRVRTYRYPYKDKLEVKHLPPSAIGFRRDLYAMSGGSPSERQRIELKTTQRIDSQGALALAAILQSGGRPMEAELAWNWTEFVASLVSRSPSRLHEISQYATARSRKLDEPMRRRYAEMRSSDWPETLDEAVALRRDDDFDNDLGKLTAERLFKAPRFTEALMSMAWQVRHFDAKPTLLLSDHPLSYSTLETPDAVAVMPLGPTDAFVAARSGPLVAALLATPDETFIKTLNGRVLKQARECVIAADQTHDEMIRSEYLPRL